MRDHKQTLLFFVLTVFFGGSGGCHDARLHCFSTDQTDTTLCRDPSFPSPTEIYYTVNRSPNQEVRSYEIAIKGEPYPDELFKQAFFHVKELGDQTLKVTLLLETFDPNTLAVLTNPQILITQYPSGDIVISSSIKDLMGRLLQPIPTITPLIDPDYAEAVSIASALLQQFKLSVSDPLKLRKPLPSIDPALAARIHTLLRDRLPAIIASMQ